jgi:hypothetical protein
MLQVECTVHRATGYGDLEEKVRCSSTLSLTLALYGVCSQHHAPAALVLNTEPTSIVQEVGGMQGRSGQVWKISPPTGIKSPDHPAPNESLYRLSSPGTQISYFIRFSYFPHIHSHTCSEDRNNVLIVNTQFGAESCDCCRKLIDVIQQTTPLNAQISNI